MITEDFLHVFDDASYPALFTERYELLECLGAKENCETLLVKNRETGGRYLAKCYMNSMIQFGQNEADILRALSHPNIPVLIECIASDTMLCVIRTYVEGISLDGFLEKRKLSEEEIIGLGLSICEILLYLHQQNPPIIYRDLKPQNIIIRKDQTVALIDFGISRSYHADSDTDTVIIGTKYFAAPEQYGFAQTDARTDIYSFGMVLRFLCNGELNQERLLLGGRLGKVIARCTEFAPRDRYQAVRDVWAALSNSRTCQQYWQGKSGVLAAILSLLVMVLVVAVILFPKGDEQMSPLIEQAALLRLGKNPNDKLTEDDYLAVDQIWIIGNNCYTDGETFYREIGRWYAEGEVRSDLTVLDDLVRFPNLIEIGIYGAHISDLTPLAGLSELVKVDFGKNDIVDATPLGEVDKLYAAHFYDNPLEEASALAEHPDIFCLDLSECDGYDPSFLSVFPFFEQLDISNHTNSFSYLSGKQIQELKMNDTDFSHLKDLAEIKGLEHLYVSHTPLASLEGIEIHTNLKTLDISYTSVTDLSPLLQLPALETVKISGSMYPYIKEFEDQLHFEFATA